MLYNKAFRLDAWKSAWMCLVRMVRILLAHIVNLYKRALITEH
jgi:hypothetical protein